MDEKTTQHKRLTMMMIHIIHEFVDNSSIILILDITRIIFVLNPAKHLDFFRMIFKSSKFKLPD